jgi:hypothetical protein
MELTRIKSFHPDQMGPLFLGGNLPGEKCVRWDWYPTSIIPVAVDAQGLEPGRAWTGGSCGARAFTGHVHCGGISGSDRRMVQTT